MSSNVHTLYCECDRYVNFGGSSDVPLWMCSTHGGRSSREVEAVFLLYREDLKMKWPEFWDFANEFREMRKREYTFQEINVYDDSDFLTDLAEHCCTFLKVQKHNYLREVAETPNRFMVLCRVLAARCRNDDNHSLSRWQRIGYTLKAIACLIVNRKKDVKEDPNTIDAASLESETDGVLAESWPVLVVCKTSWHYGYSPRSLND